MAGKIFSFYIDRVYGSFAISPRFSLINEYIYRYFLYFTVNIHTISNLLFAIAPFTMVVEIVTEVSSCHF